MKQTRNSLRHLLWIFAVTAMITGFHACDDDDVNSLSTLQYMEIENIGPGMTFQVSPYYKGITPSEFTIQQVKLNNTEVENKGFEINPETGVITIAYQNKLETGKYTVSVGCKAGGQNLTFADVLTVNMIPAAPATFKYKEPIVTFEYGYLDTAFVGEISESVSIQKFILNTEGDGQYFKIDPATGAVTLNPENKLDEPAPGHYKPLVGIETAAGKEYYPGILEFNITSKPLGLTYTPAEFQIEQNGVDTSVMPVLKGSPDELTYAIKSVTPTTDKIKIDPASGRIFTQENNALEVNSYKVAVTATNKYGTANFEDVCTCNVLAYIEPISDFAYNDATVYRLKSFNIPVAEGFKGNYITFSLIEVPEALKNIIGFDTQTGTISAPTQHSIPMGDYVVKVEAKNAKGKAEATLKIKVSQHPNYFTINYGNNLGLTPIENFANQFVYPKETTVSTIDLQETPTNTTFEIVSRYSSARHSIINDAYFFAEINSSTGQLHVTTQGQGAGAIHHLIIEASKGDGENVYKVRIPVFFQSCPDDNNPTTYTYSPFVLKINPAKGGVSSEPIFNDKLKAAQSANTLKIDFNKNQLAYFDFREDHQHLSTVYPGSGNEMYSQSVLLTHLWDQYKQQAGSCANHQPISNVEGNDFPKNKNIKLCYIDPTDFKVYINPDIWKDENGKYVNGMFWGKAVISGGASGNSYPIVIWFDPEF